MTRCRNLQALGKIRLVGLAAIALICPLLLALSLGRGDGANHAERGVCAADLHVKDITFWAWYYSPREDTEIYQELRALPVEDDVDPYPAFDVVVTLVNRGMESAQGPTVKVTLSYRVGSYPQRTGFNAEALREYEECKRKAKWQKPEWTAEVKVPLVSPRGQRRVRVATVHTSDDYRKYWKRRLWPYQARVEVRATAIEHHATHEGPVVTRELDIELGC